MDAARELRELRRIERWFTVNDPELAATLSAHGATPPPAKYRWMRLVVDALGALLVIIGVVTALFALVFTGVLVLMTGACWHATSRRRRGPATP